MKLNLPENVKNIIQKLTENGYEAYAVGGCVRDSIIRRVPGDWDITTSAKPLEVKSLFRRTIDTGIQHGTVTVMMGKEGYEITTFRIDGEYEDSRHPKSVEFTASLEEDLKRRDFTINAMAYNDEAGMVDLFDGVGDIEKGIIRCVGNPKERFTEDALRMLRAVRFSAQLGFIIDEGTSMAVRELAPTIAKVSKERIHTELNKTLLSTHPDYLVRAMELGITEIIFPVMNEIADLKEAMELLKVLPRDIVYKYAALLYQLGENKCHKMLKELKLDNYTIDTTTKLVKLHGIPLTDNVIQIRKQVSEIGVDMYIRLLEFEKAYFFVGGKEEQLNQLDLQEKEFKGILERRECLSLKELAVTGADLIANGIEPGKQMGQLLKELLEDVLTNPENNNKEYLLSKIKK